MRCPFPGMDPYIERPAIWPDFHDSLISYIREAIQPALRPKYAAVAQDRLYVVDNARAIRPDVSIVRTTIDHAPESSVATAAPDTPVVVKLSREEVREPLLYIVEPAAGNRIVTAIDVLSPDNKQPGAGRRSYLDKQEELWESGTHLVEIDLLRCGQPTVRCAHDQLDHLPPHHYLVAVTRWLPSQCELYAVPLQQRLPRVKIPLSNDDADVTLDLQAAFERCWESGPYPALLQYDADPHYSLSDDDLAWCRQRLASAEV